MDLEEWEFLSDDGFSDRQKRISLSKPNSDSKKFLESDYVLCSSPISRKIAKSNQAVPDTIRLEALDDELLKEISRNPDEIKADQAAPSQFSFNKKENEFVDMKMDSPKSDSRGFVPPIDTRTLNFEEKAEIMEISSPKLKIEKEMVISPNHDKNDGFNLWKWSFTGIGAICTFGVAAATICIFFLGSQSKNKLDHDKKIRFQIYTNDKSIKQVVEHATKLNEAISAVRGGTVNRAHITYSGYYDTL